MRSLVLFASLLGLLGLLGCRKAAAAEDRCPAGTSVVRGKGDEHDAKAEWCARPDGTRHGRYVGYWDDGAKANEGDFDNGLRTGSWRGYYRSGGVVSEGPYVAGKTHGVWVAFQPGRTYAFATCLEHGEKRWQVTRMEVPSEGEALTKPCP